MLKIEQKKCREVTVIVFYRFIESDKDCADLRRYFLDLVSSGQERFVLNMQNMNSIFVKGLSTLVAYSIRLGCTAVI